MAILAKSHQYIFYTKKGFLTTMSGRNPHICHFCQLARFKLSESSSASRSRAVNESVKRNSKAALPRRSTCSLAPAGTTVPSGRNTMRKGCSTLPVSTTSLSPPIPSWLSIRRRTAAGPGMKPCLPSRTIYSLPSAKKLFTSIMSFTGLSVICNSLPSRVPWEPVCSLTMSLFYQSFSSMKTTKSAFHIAKDVLK